MDDNSITLNSYEDGAEQYLSHTRHAVIGDNKDWLDRIISSLPKSAKVLELGSAFGRDAKYLEGNGLKVVCSDAVPKFVDYLIKDGHEAKFINVLTDDLGIGYDLILANMVFLHFEPEELSRVLSKVRNALIPNGKLAFSVREGRGSEWTKDKLDALRFYKYWTMDEISTFLTDRKWDIVDIRKGDSTNPDKIYVESSLRV